MRPIDHFFSKLASLESSLRVPASGLPPQDRRRLEQDFCRLIAPVLGAAAAADLCNRTLDRGPGGLQKLGAMAAFFLGEYDGETLEDEDWQEIRETLEDVSGDMDLNTLTSLMDELLSRGGLG
ncbi:hypothetical protein FACS189445_0140 [Spirochaetia bacterium]|nr:hypothetical protein FACS189445_0140 [Spirochaetia bacterium]